MFRKLAILLAAIVASTLIASGASGQALERCAQQFDPRYPMGEMFHDYNIVLQRYGVDKMAGSGMTAGPAIEFALAFEAARRANLHAIKVKADGEAAIKHLYDAKHFADQWYDSKDAPLPSALDSGDSGALFTMTLKIERRLEANKQEVQRLARIAFDLHAKACAEVGDPGSVKTPSIAGTWTAMKFTYVISQTGNKFTWKCDQLHENADGTIEGLSIKAHWKGDWGENNGSATVRLDGSGKAISIHWTNGVIFERK